MKSVDEKKSHIEGIKKRQREVEDEKEIKEQLRLIKL